MPPPADPKSDAAFMKFIGRELAMDDETVQSLTSGRAFKKQLPGLWEKYQTAPNTQPTKEASEGESSESSLTVDVEEAVVEEKSQSSNDDSSSLESLSSSSEKKNKNESDSDDDSSSSSSSLADDTDSVNTKPTPPGLSKEDQFIMSQGWATDTDDLIAFKSARSYAKKYLPIVEEAMKNGGVAPKKPEEQQKPALAEEADTEPEKFKAKPYGGEKGPLGTCLLVSHIPTSWYNIDASKAMLSKSAYKSALSSMGNNTREAGVLKRKLSSFEGDADENGFGKQITSVLGCTEGVQSVRPLTLHDAFLGACIIRFTNSSIAESTMSRLRGDKPSGLTTINVAVKGHTLSVSLTFPPTIPEPQPDGLFTPFILTQPPDVVRIKKKKQFDNNKEKWWEQSYSKKEEKEDPAAVQKQEVEKAKEEKKVEAISAAKTFTEYIMAKMGLDQESLDSYMSSRKFIKIITGRGGCWCMREIGKKILQKAAAYLFDDAGVHRLETTSYEDIMNGFITGGIDVFSFVVYQDEHEMTMNDAPPPPPQIELVTDQKGSKRRSRTGSTAAVIFSPRKTVHYQEGCHAVGVGFVSPYRESFCSIPSPESFHSRNLLQILPGGSPTTSKRRSRFCSVPMAVSTLEEKVDIMTGLPPESHIFHRACFVIRRKLPKSLSDVAMGLITSPSMSHITRAMLSVNTKGVNSGLVLNAATALRNLSEEELAYTAIPHITPATLNSIDSCSKAIERWMYFMNGTVAESVPHHEHTITEGPHVELDQWRTCLPKLKAVLKQANQPCVQQALSLCPVHLQTSWKEAENCVTTGMREASDMMRPLARLSQLFSPLYGDDLSLTVTALPGIFTNMLLLQHLSYHYTDLDNMTRLLKRVSIQLVTHLKGAILERCADASIWQASQTEEGLDALLQWCDSVKHITALCEESMRKAFTQAGLDLPVDDICSCIVLFGRRVCKLKQVFLVSKQFNMFTNRNIPGTPPLVDRFKSTLYQLRASSPDLLEYTSIGFDKACVMFMSSTTELETSVKVLINNAFERITDVNKASVLLKNFLAILTEPPLRHEVHKKRMIILEHFTSDMAKMSKLLRASNNKPPFYRNALPISAAVGWARLLSSKLQHCNGVLKKEHQSEGTSKILRKAIISYNKVFRELVDYENVWMTAWVQSAAEGLNGVKETPILVRATKGSEDILAVHISKAYMLTVSAARQLRIMGVTLPPMFQAALALHPSVMASKQQLQGVVEECAAVLSSIPSYLKYITRPLVSTVEKVLEPGLNGTLSWVSVGITQFISSSSTAVAKLADAMQHVRVVMNDWIGQLLECLGGCKLIDVTQVPYTMGDFIDAQISHVEKQPHFIGKWCSAVERGCHAIVDIIPKDERGDGAERGLLMHFHRQVCKEIIRATCASLDALRKLLSPRESSSVFMVKQPPPLFKIYLRLTRIGWKIDPPVGFFQRAVSQCGIGVINLTSSLKPWSGFAEASIFGDITKSKEVMKKLFKLTGVCSGIDVRLNRHLKRYVRYEGLWKGSKDTIINSFAAKDPSLDSYEEMLQKYSATLTEVRNLPPNSTVSPFLLDITDFKNELVRHTEMWITGFLKPLHKRAHGLLQDMCDVLDALQKRLKTDMAETLQDFSSLVATIHEVREWSSTIEHTLYPIEGHYRLLDYYKYNMASKDGYVVSDLRYRWRKIQTQSHATYDYISRVQLFFRNELVLDLQRFGVEVIIFTNRFKHFTATIDQIRAQDALERLRKYERTIEDIIRKLFLQYAGAKLFSLPFFRQPLLEECERDFILLLKVYELRIEVADEEEAFSSTLWVDINLSKTYANLMRLTAAFKMLPSSLEERKVFSEIKEILNTLQTHIPLFKLLSQQCVHTRHWMRLMNMCEQQWSLQEDTFCIGDLFRAELLSVREAVEELVLCATKEAHIEASLQRITAQWKSRQLVFMRHPKGWGDILKGDDAYSVKDALEESQMQLSSLLTSRHIDAFKDEVKLWVVKLSATSETLTAWLEVQAAWMHIEAVFSGGSIAMQMPDEARRFATIDQQWSKIMARAKQSDSVVQFCSGNDLSVLPSLAEQLGECQRKLSVFLEEKRTMFPRLYFVSENILLEILAQASQASSITMFLPTVFDGLTGVSINEGPHPAITMLESTDNKPVRLCNPVACDGDVEVWLEKLRLEIHYTMHDLLRSAATELALLHSSDTIDPNLFISERPSQINVVILRLLWTMDVYTALSAPRGEQRKSIQDCTKRLKEIMCALTESRRTQVHTKQAVDCHDSILVCLVHLTEVWQHLCSVKNKESLSHQWEWTKLTRVHWKADGNTCVIRNVDAELVYGYEYCGYKEQLVVTPLTERCFITMFQALVQHLGSAAIGPAGTGKTETVKELGRLCGRFVVVFNCSNHMDSKGLGRIFRGLVQSGDWGCFDEFNRIERPVLSVMASQIQCILHALKRRVVEFLFTDGRLARLNSNVGVFVTMNPNTRCAVPENLKLLFRTVTMVHPDRRVIIRIKLAALGFKESAMLAKKFDILYKLAEWQLTQQGHYDFGLRSIIAVIRTAKTALSASGDSTSKDRRGTILNLETRRRSTAALLHEEAILMDVLKSVNLPKLVQEDVQVFRSLLAAVFPGVPEKLDSSEIVKLLIENAVALKLEPSMEWIHKASQLYTTKLARHGLLLAGPAGVGKTMLLNLLLTTLCAKGEKHKELRLCPRAVNSSHMFGFVNPKSSEWDRGIFASLWKRANGKESLRTHATWLVCDGPISQDWIENLNSVMDDNKVLTLSNGDRLPMAPSTRLVFEVEDLLEALPGTVTRVGIVYLSEAELPWYDACKAVFSDAWSASEVCGLSRDVLNEVEELFYAHAEDMWQECVELVNKKLPGVTPRHVLCKCATDICNILKELQRTVDSAECYERVFWNCLSSSIGHISPAAGKTLVNRYVQAHASPVALPPGEDIFAVFINQAGKWCPLSSENMFSTSLNNFVPTAAGQNALLFALTSIKTRRPVLFVGERGCGKSTAITCLIQQYQELNPQLSRRRLVLGSSTSSRGLQHSIENELTKKMGRTYGPRSGEELYLFVDDLSAPIDPVHDHPTSELIRQLIEWNGLWSLTRTGEWKSVAQVFWTAAVNYSILGRLPNRLLRHFAVLEYPLLTEDELCHTARILAPLIPEQLIQMTVSLWSACSNFLIPNVGRTHLQWSLRDVFRVVQGLLMAPSGMPIYALWEHECYRVFADCLNDSESLQWYQSTVRDLTEGVEGSLQEQNHETKMHYFKSPEGSHYSMMSGDQLTYQLTKAKGLLTEMGNDFSEVVVFNEVVNHVARICRVLSLKGGSMLFVGYAGMGRRSMVLLAAHLCDQQCHEVTSRGSYQRDIDDFLRPVVKAAGLEGPQTVLIKDGAINQRDQFLQAACTLLDSGEVPGLFSYEDRLNIMQELRANSDNPTSSTDLWVEFTNAVQSNLHLVLCVSPCVLLSEEFSRFQGLTSGCIVNWCFPWSQASLVAIVKELISESLSQDIADAPLIEDTVAHAAAAIHHNMVSLYDEYSKKYKRTQYLTPRTIKCFVQVFLSTFVKKYEKMSKYASKGKTGLLRLNETSRDVSRIMAMVASKDEKLREAQQQQALLRAEMYESSAGAERKKAQANEEKDNFALEAEKVAAARREAVSDLNVAQPALENAKKVLDAITPQDIKQIKSLSNPPSIVRKIFDAVCLLLHIPVAETRAEIDNRGRNLLVDSWTLSGRSLASRLDFMQLIHDFNTIKKDWLNQETLELMLPYLSMEDFNFERVKKACGNVAGLCMWCRTMYDYYWVARDVEPKLKKVREAEAKMRAANARLIKAQEALDKLENEMRICEKKLEEQRERQHVIEADSAQLRKTTESANALIEGLSSEKERWIHMSQTYVESLSFMPDACLIEAAMLTYCGPFNTDFRKRAVVMFLECCSRDTLPESSIWNIEQDEADTVIEWCAAGLPNDEHSILNAKIIMGLKPYMFSFLFDPQAQGLSWLKGVCRPKGLKCIEAKTPNICEVVFECMRDGVPLIVDDMNDNVDPVLLPLLQQGLRAKTVFMEGRLHDITEGFELYFVCRQSELDLGSELGSVLSIVDFRVTESGLEEQLLSRVLQADRPELEAELRKVNNFLTSGGKRLRGLEDNLLECITQSGTALIDDSSLITTLHDIKSTAHEVKEQLTIAWETKSKIQRAREEYRPVAARGSLLYFLTIEFSKAHPVYRISLSQVMFLFDKAIKVASKPVILSRRVSSVSKTLTSLISAHYGRGLLDEHKMLFSLMLACEVLVEAGSVTQEGVTCLLTGGSHMSSGMIKCGLLSWLPQTTWVNAVAATNACSGLKNLTALLESDREEWREWYEHEAPETLPMPCYEPSLPPFERLLIIRCLREDRTIPAVAAFITATLGEAYTEPPEFSISDVIKETTPTTPVLWFLRDGADPSIEIEILAKKLKQRMLCLSMGAGQESAQWEMAKKALESGAWVLLQNVHFGIPLALKLQEYLEDLGRAESIKIQPEGRMLITSEITPELPRWLTENSFKLAGGMPVGIKASMKNALGCLTSDMLGSFKRPEYKTLVYVLCLLHSMLQGRARFGPCGWSQEYSFHTLDVMSAVMFLQNHFSMIGDIGSRCLPVSFDCLGYMVSEVFFGGNVMDECDRKILRAQVGSVFNQLRNTPLTEMGQIEIAPELFVSWDMDPYSFMNNVQDIPTADSPQTLGLHSASDATRVTEQFVNMQQQMRGDYVAGCNDIVIEHISALLESIPLTEWDNDYLDERYEALADSIHESLLLCIVHEVRYLQTLFATIHSNAVELLGVLQASKTSSTLHHIAEVLRRGDVPCAWKITRRHQSISEWIHDMKQRHAQLSGWLATGISQCVQFDALSNQKCFLAAVLREAAERAIKPLDALRFNPEFTDLYEPVSPLPSSQEVLYLSGIRLEGASWDITQHKLLPEVQKDGFPMPLLELNIEEGDLLQDAVSKDRRYQNRSFYCCPCYTSKGSEAGVVFEVPFECSNPDFWTLRSTSLIAE